MASKQDEKQVGPEPTSTPVATCAEPTAPGVNKNVDSFDHEAYHLHESRIMNEKYARTWSHSILIPDRDDLGPFSQLVSYKWTSKSRAAFLAGGDIPVKAIEKNSNTGSFKLVFVQIKAWSNKFPNHSDDLGRTHCFLRVSQDRGPVVWVWESIDGQKDNQGQPLHVIMVPNEALDTPHRRKINEEFIKMRKSEVNQLVINESAQSLPACQAMMAIASQARLAAGWTR